MGQVFDLIVCSQLVNYGPMKSQHEYLQLNKPTNLLIIKLKSKLTMTYLLRIIKLV